MRGVTMNKNDATIDQASLCHMNWTWSWELEAGNMA